MLWRGQNALTLGRGTPCSLAIILPCGVGGITSWSLLAFGEEILHKERRDFVLRQNRGVRKICRRKKTKVSRPISFYERSVSLGRGPIESLRALGADADTDINLSVTVRRGLDGRLSWLS